MTMPGAGRFSRFLNPSHHAEIKPNRLMRVGVGTSVLSLKQFYFKTKIKFTNILTYQKVQSARMLRESGW